MNLQPKTVGFKAGERNVFFHILTGCNLACKHCYINTEQHGSNMLSLATIKRWLNLFSRSNTHLTTGKVQRESPAIQRGTNLILLGGEPTMHPNLSEIISYAKSLQFTVTVDSNGYLFHDLLDKTRPDQLDYLSFSLDGPEPEINDLIRGEGVFQVCTKNIRKAVAAGFTVSLIYTVSNRNIDHLPEMVPLLKELGVFKFFIQVVGLRGHSAAGDRDRNGDSKAWQIMPERWLNVVPQVAANAAQNGIHVVYPKVYLKKGERFECAGLVAENYFIFPNGRVYRCPLCEDHPINELNIVDGRLIKNEGLMEDKFFQLSIPEGCVMNKLLQPGNIQYDQNGIPQHRISCCLLKHEIDPDAD